ncbi:hypothetical protein AVEN_118593-1 [Araneus ventricosus]|uniref:Uncharacterized protein n=1 Tax=Araneus ventricosus TaxID=182803 RepID=A0A4Y2AYC1_ARAVE|nr:hypothetical protein AVEN_118593-1 [Araneus ventricosus]
MLCQYLYFSLSCSLFTVHLGRTFTDVSCHESSPGHYDPLLHLLLSPPSKCKSPPTPISFKARERLLRVSTVVSFQHLRSFNPSGATGHPDWLHIQTSDHTPPIIIGFSHRRRLVLAWRASECPT